MCVIDISLIIANANPRRDSRSAARRRIFLKVCASCLLSGRRNVAWSTTITGVTSGAAASIEVSCFIDECVKLLSLVVASCKFGSYAVNCVISRLN